MDKEIIFTIQGWDTQNGAIEGIAGELQEYATTLGWVAQIPDPSFVPDPQNPDQVAPLIDNPKDYTQTIFYDMPMVYFWEWFKQHQIQQAYTTVVSSITTAIDTLQNQVEISSQ